MTCNTDIKPSLYIHTIPQDAMKNHDSNAPAKVESTLHHCGTKSKSSHGQQQGAEGVNVGWSLFPLKNLLGLEIDVVRTCRQTN